MLFAQMCWALCSKYRQAPCSGVFILMSNPAGLVQYITTTS